MSDARPQSDRWPVGWKLTLVLCVLVTGAVDALFLQVAQTYFTGGFNSEYLQTGWELLAFLASSAVVDAAWVFGAWWLLLPGLRRLPLSGLQIALLAALVAIVLPFAITFSRYELHRVVGNMASLELLWAGAGRSLREMISEALPHLPALAWVGVPAVAGAIVGVLLVGRLERRAPRLAAAFELPSRKALGLGRRWLLLLALGCAVQGLIAVQSAALWFGLSTKPTGMMLAHLTQRLSDPDRDGFSLVSSIADPAPFDSAIHRYAIDLPSNGIDENALAGDHPSGFRPPLPAEVSPKLGERRPHVLFILLESFRADLLDAELDGREITPYLNRLARSTARSRSAWVHSPNTAGSRAQLFSGALIPAPGGRTLVDDFKRRGYFVAHFSGQNDSFNRSEDLMGVDRADLFYDARDDVERRSSRSTSAGGLQVSWKVVNERVMQFFDSHDFETPLFAYVNYSDTHFPYHHDEVDRILDVAPLDRNEIDRMRRPEVWATYANTAANVDRAIERLVARWREHIGDRDHAIVITADHGQALFEEDFLGHGQAITAEQTRTPLIVEGIGGRWPEPIGLSDLRGLLSQNLFSTGGDSRQPVRFVPTPGRTLLQAVPDMEMPFVLGLRELDRLTTYDLRTGELSIEGGDGESLGLPEPQRSAAFDRLIWTWEAHRLDARGMRYWVDATGPPADPN